MSGRVPSQPMEGCQACRGAERDADGRTCVSCGGTGLVPSQPNPAEDIETLESAIGTAEFSRANYADREAREEAKAALARLAVVVARADTLEAETEERVEGFAETARKYRLRFDAAEARADKAETALRRTLELAELWIENDNEAVMRNECCRAASARALMVKADLSAALAGGGSA